MNVDEIAVFQLGADLSEKTRRDKHTLPVRQIIRNVLVIRDLDSFDGAGCPCLSAVEPGRASAVCGENLNRVTALDESPRQIKSCPWRAAVLQRGIKVGDDKRNLHAT